MNEKVMVNEKLKCILYTIFSNYNNLSKKIYIVLDDSKNSEKMSEDILKKINQNTPYFIKKILANFNNENDNSVLKLKKSNQYLEIVDKNRNTEGESILLDMSSLDFNDIERKCDYEVKFVVDYIFNLDEIGKSRFFKEVEKTIEKILDLGVETKLNQELERDFAIEDLAQKYDAVFVAIGANIPAKMNVEGENLNGVYGGNYLLEYNRHPNYTGKKVAIIGGGNVAMDSARTIKKLGASEVYVIYRRAEEQMPAEKKEIADAKKEGIEFLFQTNIVKILGKEKVKKLECIKTELVKKEGENRLSPVNIEGSNFSLDMDYVVMATGSKPENNIIEKFEKNEYGYIKIDENMQTSINKVFAGGDIVGQKATVAWAARSGRDAAEKILKITCNIM